MPSDLPHTLSRLRRPLVRTCVMGLIVPALGLPASGALAAGLPDGRAYEQVSEVQKNGNEAGIGSGTLGVGYATAALSGERIVYFQVGPAGETLSGTDLYSVASRDPQIGWRSKAALPPGYGANASNFLLEQPERFLASTDLSRFLFAAVGSFQHENPDATASAALYRAGPESLHEAEWWLSRPTLPSFSEAKPEPGHITHPPSPAGGSSDLSTSYFTWNGILTSEDQARSPHVTVSGGVPEGPHGFYEWDEGKLKSAGELPDHTFSPWGAVPAASQTSAERYPSAFALRNQVSQDGAKAFFVSPQPEYASEAGAPTELYLREQTATGSRSVLVSRDELNGGIAAAGSGSETAVTPVRTTAGHSSYVYASPDGSRAFFESQDTLARSATGESPEGPGPWMYEFNTAQDKVTYIPGVTGNILASSRDGSRLLFAKLEDVSIEREFEGRGEELETTTETFTVPVSLDLWAGGATPPQTVATWSVPSKIAAETRGEAEEKVNFSFPFASGAQDGSVFVFQTSTVLTSGAQEFNNRSAQNEVYRYEPGAAQSVVCVSCAPAKGTSTSAFASGFYANGRLIADEGGRVFFSTAAKLVPQDVNGVEDVYEWEQEGVGSCPPATPSGCTYLMSSGTSPEPSFYLDNDEVGENVFFSTRQGLAKADTDEGYDVYDARVHGGIPTQTPQAGCAEACAGAGTTFVTPPLASLATGPSGNLQPAAGQSNTVTATPKVKIVKHSVKGHGATIVLDAPVAGTVTLSGRGLRSVHASTRRGGKITLKTTLTLTGVSALKKHHGPLKVKLQVSFHPAHGGASTTSTFLRFS
jgi:hypothetical protein